MPSGVGGYNGNSIDAAADTVARNVSASEANLMEAFSLREGGTDAASVAAQIALGEKLGIVRYEKDANGNIKLDDQKNPIKLPPDLKGLQLIAERRYQHSNQIYTMFSSLLDKMDQMKQRLIQKFGQG
jgi:hypothetical protein